MKIQGYKRIREGKRTIRVESSNEREEVRERAKENGKRDGEIVENKVIGDHS